MKGLRTARKVGRQLGTLFGLAFAAAPGGVIASVVTQLVGAILGLVASYQVQGVVQAAVSGDSRRAMLGGITLAAVAGASSICFLAYARFAPRLVEAITIHLDSELVRLTAQIPTLDYADRPLHADKISLIRSSSQELAGGIQATVLNLRIFVTLTGTLVILIGIDPWLALLPIFAIPRVLAGQKARKLVLRAQEANAEPMRLRAHIFNHAISPVAGKELRIFGLGPELAQRYRQITAKTRRIDVRMNWGGELWSATGDVALTAGCMGAIWWLVVQAAAGAVSTGGVVLAATLATGLILQISYALQFAHYLRAIVATAERYLWLVDFSNASVNAVVTDMASPAVLRRGIRVEGVSFAYPDRDTPVLVDVTLDLPAGRVIALVGENGSGKSTLVKLLCGFYPPTSGRILVDGADMARIGPTDWHGRISGAFQDFTNLEVVLHESVGLGQLARLGEREPAAAALERAGAADLANVGAEGLDTMLGKRWGGIELSGGQWQKLALSRALMRESPLIVVFDEPAAALDPSAEHDMFERFAAEARSGEAAGRSTLLVSHRFSTVRMADAIAVLDGGRIVEFGPHDALIADAGKYAELFEMQANAYR